MTAIIPRNIFLSHSGFDATLATSLASDLRFALRARGGPDVAPEVFNTSEPKYRFANVSPSDEKRLFGPFDMYKDPLSAYLAEQVRTAEAYLLLVTPNSLKAQSKWIEFEMSIAEEVYRSLVIRARPGVEVAYFFLCLADGAKVENTPRSPTKSKAIDVEHREGVWELAKEILEVFDSRTLRTGLEDVV